MIDELKPCEWRAVPGFEGRYEVSDTGLVRSWWIGARHLRTPKLKKIQRDKDGYPFVGLYISGKVKGYRVSRLILLAFCGAPATAKEASHLDGDKTNNVLSNLQWETRQQNEDRKRQHGTRPTGENNAAHRFTASDVLDMRRRREHGEKLSQIAERYGTSQSLVSQICRRVIWQTI